MTVESNIPYTTESNIINSPIQTSFKQFVLGNKQNKAWLLIALVGAIVQMEIFKFLYPYPDFISDSYSYIATNIYNMDVNLWPIGYSKFIWTVHQISHSDTLLVTLQYVVLEISLLYFYFSLSYLYRPTKGANIILFTFLLFNPISLYLSNSILSDALFASLTIVFFTQFLWMLHKPTIRQVLLQGIIIGVAFTIRYTAIYYPLVALAGMLLSKHIPFVKVWGVLLSVILIIPFVLYTKQKTKEVTGTAEFSVFGGWQIANNALYMYNHILVDSNRLPHETRDLDRTSKLFFKKFHPSTKELEALPGTYFIKVPWAVLKPYMHVRYSYYNPIDEFKSWGQVSPIYNKYGTYLIKRYPIDFLRYYIWLNIKNYFLPHLEKFGTYNLEMNTVPSDVQEWFDYPTPYVNAVSVTFQGKLFFLYPILFMMLNTYFIGCIIWLLATGRFKKLRSYFRLTLLLAGVYLLLNFGFSVFTTPVVFRYQVVPFIILFAFSILLLDLPDNLKQPSKNKTY